MSNEQMFTWGFDHNFTNYNFRQNNLDWFKQIYCQRGEQIKVSFEIQRFVEMIVGEIVAKPPYKMCPRPTADELAWQLGVIAQWVEASKCLVCGGFYFVRAMELCCVAFVCSK